MNRRTSKNRYLYICESPVLNAYKIGYHTGELYGLYKRYQTPLTNKVCFIIFPTDHPERNEKILHRVLEPYKIDNELFQKSDDLFQMYCYMAKAITGCDRIKCYSREKYGYPRDKNKWEYQKLETKEEDAINIIVNNIIKTGNIITNDNSSENINGVIDSMSSMHINSDEPQNEVSESLMTQISNISLENDDSMFQDDINDKYIDNPFGKWAYKEPKTNIYRQKRKEFGLH